MLVSVTRLGQPPRLKVADRIEKYPDVVHIIRSNQTVEVIPTDEIVRFWAWTFKNDHSCIACGRRCNCGSLQAVQCQLCATCMSEADEQFRKETESC